MEEEEKHSYDDKETGLNHSRELEFKRMLLISSALSLGALGFFPTSNTASAMSSTNKEIPTEERMPYYMNKAPASNTFTEPEYVQTGLVSNFFVGIPETISEGVKVTASSYEHFDVPNDTKGNENFFGKNIVVTIDDCYSNEYTRELFETLREGDVTATFFPNTRYLSMKNEETVKLWKEIYESGFEIGYHTANHTDGMNKEMLNQDFDDFVRHMRELLGDPEFSIKVVRAPYGNWDSDWMDWVKERGLFNVRWNVGPNQGSDYVRSILKNDISPIVILHSRYEDTRWLSNMLPELVDIAKENGSRVGSVYDCKDLRSVYNPLQ